MNECMGGVARKDERGVRHVVCHELDQVGEWRSNETQSSSDNSTTVISYRGEKVVAGKSNVACARIEKEYEERRTERERGS